VEVNKNNENQKKITRSGVDIQYYDELQSPRYSDPTVVESKTSDIIPFSRQICETINQVRTNPAQFITALEAHLELFIDDLVYRDKTGKRGVNIRTNEGKAAVREAILFLKKAVAQSPLSPSTYLECSAVDHLQDMWANGLSGHEVHYILS